MEHLNDVKLDQSVTYPMVSDFEEINSENYFLCIKKRTELPSFLNLMLISRSIRIQMWPRILTMGRDLHNRPCYAKRLHRRNCLRTAGSVIILSPFIQIFVTSVRVHRVWLLVAEELGIG